jgi:hypothetical protein
MVEPGAGWFGAEHNSRHRWVWAETHGRLSVQTWPRPARAEVRLTLKLIGPTPRTVRALVDGREIWSGPIFKKLTTVNLPPLVVTGGHLELELTTDSPPVLENERSDARRLGFALYDPAIDVSEQPSLAQ